MKLLKAFTLFFISCFLLSCSDQSEHDAVIVGTSADNPPYEFIQQHEIVGMDIDIIKAIGKKMNKKIFIKNIDFVGLVAALSTENIDLAIAGMSVTPERTNHVDFSDSYAQSLVAVLYRLDDALNAPEDLSDKIVGAQLGTTWAEAAKEMSINGGFKVRTLNNNLILVEELKMGAIDAVFLEEYQAKKFVKNNPTLATFTIQELVSDFAVAFPKGSTLKDEVNKAIKELQESGEIERIREKWLSIGENR